MALASKFASRKLLVTVAAFIATFVVPHVSEADRLKYGALVVAVYTAAQGYADRGAGTGSQGSA